MPRIRIKRGTTAQWDSSTTPLLGGELGYDTVLKTIKIGDGTTLWNSLLPLNKYEIDEISQDAIYSALTHFVSSGSNITVTYNDEGNYIVLDTGPEVVLKSDLETALSSLGNTIDEGFVPLSSVGNPDGIATLDPDGKIPDSEIPDTIARDSEIITSYSNLLDLPTLFSGDYADLDNKPAIALGAVAWTENHYQLEGGANTRYLAGDIVWHVGNIYVANFDNESLPTSNTEYWTLIGTGNRLNIDGRDIPNILWNNILQKPTLFSGSYDDLTSKPTLFSGSYNDLTNKPTIPSLTGYATETYVGTAISNLIDGAGPALDTLNELAAAINDDASFASTVTTALGNKLDSSTASSTYLTQTDASTTYAPLANPTFTGTVSGVTKTHVGLSNVDNTSDADKPVSTAVQSALDLKAPLADPTFTGTVGGITKSMVGLGSVDNTTDADKPVSTATQTALDLKLNLSDPSVDYYITNSGTGSYTVNGVANGLITFEKGKKYRIHMNASGHPFWIQTVSGAYSSGNVYSTGITNGGEDVGYILVELPQNAPDSLYYACEYHSSMQGSISVQSDNTITTNAQASNYTIAPIDSGRLIEMSGGGTLTITDSASFPVGFYVDVLQTGSSQVTIAGTSFTPNATPGLKLRAQWSSATLIKRALNSWVVLGDLSA